MIESCLFFQERKKTNEKSEKINEFVSNFFFLQKEKRKHVRMRDEYNL